MMKLGKESSVNQRFPQIPARWQTNVDTVTAPSKEHYCHAHRKPAAFSICFLLFPFPTPFLPYPHGCKSFTLKKEQITKHPI